MRKQSVPAQTPQNAASDQGQQCLFEGISMHYDIAVHQILETVVTFHFKGCKVYSLNKGCHTCMIKHNMHVQSLYCSIYLTWLDVCIYLPRSHIHFLKRMLGKGQLRTA